MNGIIFAIFMMLFGAIVYLTEDIIKIEEEIIEEEKGKRK